MVRNFFIFFFSVYSWALHAELSYVLTIGPEIYHITRIRDGGTHQDGRIDGIKISLERIKPLGYYIGADYLFATGWMHGETATSRPLSSDLTDQIFEARLGFVLSQAHNNAFITPFGGWGYFKEINDFQPPSPLPCKFTDTFQYFAIGFLSGVHFVRWLSMGINFKLRFMQNATSEVSRDPLYNKVTLLIKDELHVRVDVPFTLAPPTSLFNLLFSPFFEYRHFGGREGYPFNFRDTKFYLYGTRFALTYRF